MTQKRSRPPHLSSEEKPPENVTRRVISPIAWHYPPVELNLMPPERVAAAVAGRTTFDAELLLAESIRLPGPIAIVVAVAAVVLWTPQYMMFFVWRMGD